jgi:hypothetical protein
MSSGGKWMFGGSSDPALLAQESPNKLTGNRTLSTGYTEGGMNIGDSDISGKSARTKSAAAAYRASLDMDKVRASGRTAIWLWL